MWVYINSAAIGSGNWASSRLSEMRKTKGECGFQGIDLLSLKKHFQYSLFFLLLHIPLSEVDSGSMVSIR